MLLSAQTDLLDWIHDDERTVLFRIDPEEIPSLLYNRETSTHRGMRKYLHTPIGVYKKNEPWSLPGTGHYLVAMVKPSGQFIHHQQSVPFRVTHFSEYGFLTLQVMDAEGNVCSQARVRIQSPTHQEQQKPFTYDPETATYRLPEKDIPEKSLLVIENEGFTAWYNTQKHMPYLRGGRRYHNKTDLSTFFSYMVTDKNQYRPDETVRFKTYALGPDKKQLTDSLELWISIDYQKEQKIATLTPYHPGGYQGEFELNGIDGLTLDRQYTIYLKNNQAERIATTSFNYKDYELRQASSKAFLELHTQFPHETNRVLLEAIDPNGLPLQGATATVTLLPVELKQTFAPTYLLPDTFMQKKVTLSGPTAIEIPGEIFGKANLSYQVQVEITTPDHYSRSYTLSADYFYRHRHITLNTLNEEHHFEYWEEGRATPAKATLYINDEEKGTEINLPYHIPVNQQVNNYRVAIPSSRIVQTFDLYEHYPFPRIQGHISSNVLYIKTSNPAGLDMTWFIYCGETLLYKGTAREINDCFSLPETNTICYVEAFCHVGEKEKKIQQSIIPQTRYLHITNDLPERIYPGQEIDATLTIQDETGQPAAGVDLTAFAINATLNYKPQQLPS